jgi:integral membrane protein (TIGR01906 family)
MSPILDRRGVLRRHLPGLLSLYLTIAVPVLLTLFSVRLVMSPVFLQIEYNRPDFPQDSYGFTQEDRFRYAPMALDYLIYNHDIDFLADLAFPDGTPLYNARELRHMEDVQVVTRYAFALLILGSLGAVAAGIVLWRDKSTRHELRQGLFNGSVLTLGIIGVIVAMAVTAWDFFFTAFHTALFERGTWRFAYSDTLIRLFPERFWFDVAVAIGALTIVGAVTILTITWRWKRVELD